MEANKIEENNVEENMLQEKIKQERVKIENLGKMILRGYFINVLFTLGGFFTLGVGFGVVLIIFSLFFAIILSLLMFMYFYIQPNFKADMIIHIILICIGVFLVYDPAIYILSALYIYSTLIPINFIYMEIVNQAELSLIRRWIARFIFIFITILAFALVYNFIDGISFIT